MHTETRTLTSCESAPRRNLHELVFYRICVLTRTASCWCNALEMLVRRVCSRANARAHPAYVRTRALTLPDAHSRARTCRRARERMLTLRQCTLKLQSQVWQANFPCRAACAPVSELMHACDQVHQRQRSALAAVNGSSKTRSTADETICITEA
eukprot:6197245-Pleurochrysis_carterae.AAC.4